MIKDISKLKIGDKVHYMPDYNIGKKYNEETQQNEDIYENGIIKEIPEHSLDSVRVVYNCNGDWKNYKDYTSALTDIRDLYIGWKH